VVAGGSWPPQVPCHGDFFEFAVRAITAIRGCSEQPRLGRMAVFPSASNFYETEAATASPPEAQ
jgi:hypothetical protein